MTFSSKIKYILIIGLAIRIILSFSTFHPDITAFDLAGQLIAKGNILNLYDYLPEAGKSNAYVYKYGEDLFIYPPLIYFYHAIFGLFLNNLIDPNILNNFIINIPKSLGNWQINLHLFFLKLPYFVFDIGTAFMLMRLFKDDSKKYLVFVLWMLNPVSIYATYMMGQFDIIPTFFVVYSLYLTTQNRLEKAAFMLGIGAAFKVYPLFLLIPLVLLVSSYRERIKLFSLGVLPYIALIMPFIFSRGFRHTALLANLTQKSFYAQISISGGESIVLFLAVMTFFYLLFIKIRPQISNIWQYYFIVLLVFFIFTHYHPQWFVWLTPFLVLEMVYSKFENIWATLASLFSFAGLLFLFEPSLTVGIFAPLYPQLYNMPSIWQMMHINIDIGNARSILQTIFVGSAFYYIYNYFPKGNLK